MTDKQFKSVAEAFEDAKKKLEVHEEEITSEDIAGAVDFLEFWLSFSESVSKAIPMLRSDIQNVRNGQPGRKGLDHLYTLFNERGMDRHMREAAYDLGGAAQGLIW